MEIDRDAKDKLARSQRSLQSTRRAEDEERAARARTPPAVPGRRHAEANTEVFLEVLSDRAPEEEAGVQTDAHLDRPPEPIFVPQPVRSAPAVLVRPPFLVRARRSGSATAPAAPPADPAPHPRARPSRPRSAPRLAVRRGLGDADRGGRPLRL